MATTRGTDATDPFAGHSSGQGNGSRTPSQHGDKLQLLKEEIAQLRRANASMKAALGDDDTDPPEIDFQERLQKMEFEKMKQPMEPGEYTSGSFSDAKAFIRSCEGVFKMQPHVYYTQAERYSYAASRLRGAAAAGWESHLHSHGPEVERWARFKRWLLDSLRDPADAAFKLFRSPQRPRQRVAQYAAFLETMEHDSQMPPFTEDQRIQLLISGLTPTLKDKLWNQPTIPNKRDELISLLTRLEDSIPRTHTNRKKRHRKRQRSDPKSAIGKTDSLTA